MNDTTLYLVRHAIAEERGDEWPDDDLRPLTREGIRRFTQAVRGFLTLEQAPQRILTSPLVRARQTAELLAAGTEPPVPLVVMDELSPGESPGDVLTQVRKLSDYESLALVGHEPDLGYLAAHLVGAKHPMPFKKGGMCRIDVTWGRPPRGTLAWFLPPKALRRLARAPDEA
jgi:phosphohistidine phosphatase